jgi:glycosyltransferase involved in cell wall biosynthesis
VLYRLLRTLEEGCYCLISRQDYSSGIDHGDLPSMLQAQYYHLPEEFGMGWLSRSGLLRMGSWLKTIQRARRILRILRREQCNAVVACTGDLYDLPAGYLASRWAGARYYVYLFDDYSYQWVAPAFRAYAERWERVLMEGAAGVIVPNEFLGEEYKHRYGIKPIVIHNPYEESEIGRRAERNASGQQGEIKIVYTGAIYHAHYDAFQNMLCAIREIGRPGIRLHLYTAQCASDLEQHKITGPVVIHSHLPSREIAQVQQEADLLFLALAFKSPIPEVIKTSAPGKMGEYLASGRPILVHAPSDSFLSWYFRKHGCGLVVDEDRPSDLTEAIRRILGDETLRQRVVEKALARAEADFNVKTARSEFMKLLNGTMEE